MLAHTVHWCKDSKFNHTWIYYTILISSLYYIIINSAEGQLMRNKLNKLRKRRWIASPSDSIGQSPSADRSLTPGRKTPLQHKTLQPCRSAFLNMTTTHEERTTIKFLILYAIWLWGSKFSVFAKNPIFSYNKGLLCKYYKMLVVIEMVPPTNVSFPIIK